MTEKVFLTNRAASRRLGYSSPEQIVHWASKWSIEPDAYLTAHEAQGHYAGTKPLWLAETVDALAIRIDEHKRSHPRGWPPKKSLRQDAVQT